MKLPIQHIIGTQKPYQRLKDLHLQVDVHYPKFGYGQFWCINKMQMSCWFMDLKASPEVCFVSVMVSEIVLHSTRDHVSLACCVKQYINFSFPSPKHCIQ